MGWVEKPRARQLALVCTLMLLWSSLAVAACAPPAGETSTTPSSSTMGNSERTTTSAITGPDGDPFGLGPGNTGDRPGYLTASDSGITLEAVREQVTSRLPAGDPDGGGRYAFLPYRLPDGFAPALDWGGEKLGDQWNPVVWGRFYAVAFSDDHTAIRLVVNPASAPASISWTLPPRDLVWERTGAGCMQREASEAVRDGIDYFCFQMPDDEIIVYGPQGIRPVVWKLAEGLVPLVVGGGADLPATMPADFNFVLRYGVEAKNVLDTRRETFTYDMISDPSITVHLALASEEMAEIYARLRDVDFWSYPLDLKTASAFPTTRYEMSVSGADLEHATKGNDLHYAASLRAVALWKLIERVQEMIMATDAFKALPEPRGGYL